MRSLIALSLLLISTTAFAQVPQTPPQQSPAEQALASKLMEEINSNLNLRAQIVQLQEQIKQKDAKPAEAKPDQPHPEKLEPKK